LSEKKLNDLATFEETLKESVDEKFQRGFDLISAIIPLFQRFAKTDSLIEEVYSDVQDDPYQLTI
jgi:hypothetical protein